MIAGTKPAPYLQQVNNRVHYPAQTFPALLPAVKCWAAALRAGSREGKSVAMGHASDYSAMHFGSCEVSPFIES